MRLVNIGCGNVFHPDWTNLDAVSQSHLVVQHDVRSGLPFADSSVAAVYSSHLIEHLRPEDAEALLLEILRVIQPGGVVRLVVPDLELLTKQYLEQLSLMASDTGSDDNYDWSVIQLLDQMVRHVPGGEMSIFFRDRTRQNDEFVSARAGPETEALLKRKRVGVESSPRPLLVRMRSRGLRWFIRTFREHLAWLFVWVCAGKEEADAFKIGGFRSSGEIHQWMYDRYSLARLLRKIGFEDPRICAADESSIPNFTMYGLDVIAERRRKPDSLYMEAMKPAK